MQSSLLQSGLGLMDFQAARFAVDGEVPHQAGNFHPTSIPTGVYKARDLAAPGSGLTGIVPALEFLTASNRRGLGDTVAAFEDVDEATLVIQKFQGALWAAPWDHSPRDVVAWHGNLAPYRYDLSRFNTINTVSFDHPDPSIFTVLTSPSDTPGTANCDFVIFPPRWMVAEHSFRPPWYHRNVMSEFMGLVLGQYDAKPEGFRPGGASLHNAFVPHGPDLEAFTKASEASLAPHKLDNTLAFMFETRWRLRPTAFALDPQGLDPRYAQCWAGLNDCFQACP